MGICKTIASRWDNDPEFRFYHAGNTPAQHNTTTMPTPAIIASVEYINSFPSQYGDADGKLHAYRYTFEDGTTGSANHKAAPSWKAGDEVEYTITGDFHGENKLKVTKVGASGPPQRHGAPPTRAAAPARSGPPPARQNAGNGQGTAIFGATVGMALNNAALDYRAAGFEINDAGKAKAFLWQRASLYLRIADTLESGTLHGDTPASAPAAPAPQRQPAPTAAPAARASRPAPTDDGSAFGSDDAGADDGSF